MSFRWIKLGLKRLCFSWLVYQLGLMSFSCNKCPWSFVKVLSHTCSSFLRKGVLKFMHKEKGKRLLGNWLEGTKKSVRCLRGLWTFWDMQDISESSICECLDGFVPKSYVEWWLDKKKQRNFQTNTNTWNLQTARIDAVDGA
ncbi:hypothetical protein TorRG33x02_155700 [Trema orientale]|uniref:Uncharacterized protein n=1 Tax=Trema orientale TaxID=63057 RepID=A0A2P5ET34_TREOI|nr:hypothetical protein TorRG33x02_155700 [Trema orientale]